MPEAREPRLTKAPDDTRDVVADLVERYQRNADQYAAASYREAQLRQEFIDPFFEALGWDIANEQGYAEPYKEVIHEDAIKVRGATRAPDYCFRIGGQRKFFLEAKKPSVHIKTDPSPAYQLRRYGWSAKLPLSILTDFEEFAVYDCSKRPQETDGPSVARVDFITYDEYGDRLDDIYSIFAKEAILKGSFDRYAEGTRRKRGTTEVDSEFLQEIEQWREMLAKDIARHNLDLSVHDLNFAVQTTIDRILFFRIAEDRGVEPYGRLRDLLDGTGLYPRLCQLYQQADTKYNAGLFDFSASGDRLTPDLEVSDKALQSILAELYYPQCPYEFSVIGADILGAVYEQFLGKVIRLTPSHRAKVEEKPEVKKAGGVYYTPTYIVDYIVEHTVGPALEEAEAPEAASKLRILDPACGSGSFLLGAYQYLLNWHLDYYTNHSPKKHARGKQPAIIQVRENEWRLSTFERKRILLNNIYGVDIDPQAVEVTKLNLLLKCMEGETEETLSGQLQLAQERVLPNIDDNIKCGNSLIGPDYYQGKQLALLDEEEARRVNAFDWDAEFPEIMAAGGFDCVIGNPPWGASFSDDEKIYLREAFSQIHMRTPESFLYFTFRGMLLLGASGTLAFILPSSFLGQAEFGKLRTLIIHEYAIKRVANLGDGVFPRVTAPACVIVVGRPAADRLAYQDLRRAPRSELPALLLQTPEATIASKEELRNGRFVVVPRAHRILFEKCFRLLPLGEVAEDVATGVSSGYDAAYVMTEEEAYERGIETAVLRPLVTGAEVLRYSVWPKSHRRIIYLTPQTRVKEHPNTEKWLSQFKPRLLRRREAKNGKIPWFSLNWPRRRKLFERPKIIIRQTSPRIMAGFDDSHLYALKSIIIVQLAEEDMLSHLYMLGLLNSKLMDLLYSSVVDEAVRVFPEVKPINLQQLPIRTIDCDDPADVARHDKMVELVETMLELHKRLAKVKTPRSRERIQRQIAATDQAIDKLVYELYDLTDEEIAIVAAGAT